tara:strand:+ start:6582 stop:7499 length:918 start_codon:yes stop_codon:yes gene_type:complete
MISKIKYHIMPWEIDYALLTFTQLKKSSYYLSTEDEVRIDITLNLSSYLIDWESCPLPKQYFIQKCKDLLQLLTDYKVNLNVYEGDKIYGIIEQQREIIEDDIDYYIEINPDMYFSETLLYSLIESAKVTPNEYFIITPQLYKMWDHTWDMLTNKKYLNIPYKKWDEVDIFDIRFDSKQSSEPLELQPTSNAKFCNWFDIYNKAFYEKIAAVQDDWKGYGAKDTYAMVLGDYAQSKGVDFQQYVLKGQTIFDYQVGPLKQRDFRSYYLDLIPRKEVPNQREEFDKNWNLYINRGIQMLHDKKVIK